MNHSQNKPSDRATPGPGSLNAILLPGALACLLSVLLVGCGNPAREACYAKSRAAFVVDQEECEDEACIDALLARRKAEQEACP